MEITYDVWAGEAIWKSAEKCIQIAKARGAQVEFVFNDVRLVAHADDTVADVLERYHTAREATNA